MCPVEKRAVWALLANVQFALKKMKFTQKKVKAQRGGAEETYERYLVCT